MEEKEKIIQEPVYDKKATKKALTVILFTIFIDLVGYGILIPVIPLLFADPTSEFYLLQQNIPVHNGLILLGLLIAIFPFMQFLATPILGQLSDKYGRKKILAISIFGTAFSYVLFAIGIITKNIPLLFFSRALDGITGGNIAVAHATIADITPPKDRAKRFGLIGAVFGIGFILGPFIGGKLSDPHVLSWFSASTPFWFAAILATVNVISLLIFLPETNMHKKNESLRPSQSIKNIKKAINDKSLRALFLTLFLFSAGFAFYTGFFGVLLIKKFSFHQGNIGDYFAYVGLWIAFSQVFIIRKFSNRYQEYQVLRFSFFVSAFAISIYLFAIPWWMIFFVAPIFAISNGLSTSFMMGLISKSGDHTNQGEIMGISSSVQAMAQIIPPILGGLLAAIFVYYAPLVVAMIFMIVSGISFWMFYKLPKNDYEKEVVVENPVEPI